MASKRGDLNHRIKIVAGQVNGLERMILNGAYCVDILTQSLAIQNALKEIDRLVLKRHLKTCTVEQMKGGEEQKATRELLRIFGMSRKG